MAGRTNSEIARELVITDKTVSTHVSNMLRRFDLSSRVGLAELAIRRAGREDA